MLKILKKGVIRHKIMSYKLTNHSTFELCTIIQFTQKAPTNKQEQSPFSKYKTLPSENKKKDFSIKNNKSFVPSDKILQDSVKTIEDILKKDQLSKTFNSNLNELLIDIIWKSYTRSKKLFEKIIEEKKRNKHHQIEEGFMIENEKILKISKVLNLYLPNLVIQNKEILFNLEKIGKDLTNYTLKYEDTFCNSIKIFHPFLKSCSKFEFLLNNDKLWELFSNIIKKYLSITQKYTAQDFMEVISITKSFILKVHYVENNGPQEFIVSLREVENLLFEFIQKYLSEIPLDALIGMFEQYFHIDNRKRVLQISKWLSNVADSQNHLENIPSFILARSLTKLIKIKGNLHILKLIDKIKKTLIQLAQKNLLPNNEIGMVLWIIYINESSI